MKDLIFFKILIFDFIILTSMLVGEIDHIIIYDSTTSNRINKWYIVNDGVMGGYSIGSFSKDKRGMVFFQVISLQQRRV